MILAVRNVSKGNAVVERLRCEMVETRGGGEGTASAPTKPPPTFNAKAMQLDVDRSDSILQFTKQLREEIPIVDILILNAGISLLKPERSPTGHNRINQVNYYFNALLLAELLLHLQAGADKTGHPARVTWVGSRPGL